jgi:solute carrier family 50 protein (sugar transporter)
MKAANNVFIALVAPSIGVALNMCMWFAPLKSVNEVKKSGVMGSLNPYPFVITIVNCTGWVIYGCMTRNYFVALSNTVGAASSTFYALSTLPFIDNYDQEAVVLIMVAGILLWGIIGIIASCAFPSSDSSYHNACLYVGYVAMVFGIAFYAGGLTKMWEIVRNRDSSSIHIPSVLINTINAALWTLYAFATLNDISIWLPNFLGLILSLIQLGFVFFLPRKKLISDVKSEVDNPIHSEGAGEMPPGQQKYYL